MVMGGIVGRSGQSGHDGCHVGRRGGPALARLRIWLDALERKASVFLGDRGPTLLAEHAWQMVEAWALVGQRKLPRGWNTRRVRQDREAKRLLEQVARERGLMMDPGEGRDTLGREAAASYLRLLRLCREDVATLHRRVMERVAQT